MPKPGPKPYECIRRAWHSESHVELRRSLIAQMCKVVMEIHKPQTHANKEWQEKLPKVIMRVEEILYSKAKSQAEYMDLDTLQQRMNQAIDTMIGITDGSDDATDGPQLLPCIEAALSLCCQPSTSPTPRCGRQSSGGSRRGCSQAKHRFASHSQRTVDDVRTHESPHVQLHPSQMHHMAPPPLQEHYYRSSPLMMPPIASGAGQVAAIVLPQRMMSSSISAPDPTGSTLMQLGFPSRTMNNPMLQSMHHASHSPAIHGTADCVRPASVFHRLYDWTNRAEAPCSSGSVDEIPVQRAAAGRECGPRLTSDRWVGDIDLNRAEESGGVGEWPPMIGELDGSRCSFSQSSPDSSSKNTVASPSCWSGPTCDASKDGEGAVAEGGMGDGAVSALSSKDDKGSSPEAGCPMRPCSNGSDGVGWAARRAHEKFESLLCLMSQEDSQDWQRKNRVDSQLQASIGDTIPAKDEDMIIVQQKWLEMIRHFATCMNSQGPCRMPELCNRAASLRAHLFECSARDCKHPLCAQSKALFDHFSRCVDRCPVCVPVRSGGFGVKRPRYN